MDMQDRIEKVQVHHYCKTCSRLADPSRSGSVLTMDLHAGQIQGFFDIPVDDPTSPCSILQRHQKEMLQ